MKITRGFPETSVFGRTTLDLEVFPKPTGFWKSLTNRGKGRRGAIRIIAGLLCGILCPALSSLSCGKAPTVRENPGPSEAEEGDLAEELARLSAADQGTGSPGPGAPEDGTEAQREDIQDVYFKTPGNEGEGKSLRRILDLAGLPEAMARRITAATPEDPAFIIDLLKCLRRDPYLRILVDKQHALPAEYEPADLVVLKGGSYEVSRENLRLRRAAAASLEEMAAAARTDGVILVVSSCYRSYEYQTTVYNRNVREMGREAADRESARPGYSQHQLGLVADFGSITDAFAETAAGRWLYDNAGRFGWSLSFPDGYEAVTGYRQESWHYRYVGRDLTVFIDAWFGGIQQYALQFIHAWESG
jgi:D-alanyl-D-alanine carboxypeptidase